MPPGTGICHQVNLEFLSQTVWTGKAPRPTAVELAYPDTLVGTDSHTTMVNGLAVLGWGVGGIEAEAAMLGQPVSMLIPEVIGFKLTGKLREGVTATDLVLTVTQMLRKKGVVGKFVEFYGPGLADMSVADRATIGNMAPEYGATCGFFPIDEKTIAYLKTTSRTPERVRAGRGLRQGAGHVARRDDARPGLHRHARARPRAVVPSMAGPKRPQDRVELDRDQGLLREAAMEGEFRKAGEVSQALQGRGRELRSRPRRRRDRGDHVLHQHVEPERDDRRGLLARNAVAKGLRSKPWVKTSLAPGSQVVEEYFEKAGLQGSLDALGFNIVGFGCTTCIGNSGPLPEAISKAINDNDLVAGAVISGNRNFEGRVNPDVRANYLASPPLVVAYALAGSLADRPRDRAARPRHGRRKPVYLKDIWPSSDEIAEFIDRTITSELFGSPLRRRLRGRRALEKRAGLDGPHLRMADRLDLHPEPALFRGHAEGAGPDHRHRGRPHPGPLQRFDHDRPHLARRQHPGRVPGRQAYLQSHQVRVPTSTSTARGAATTK